MTKRPLPQSEYRGPIIQVLCGMGGKGKRADVLEHIEKKLGDHFTDADYALHKSGPVVWETRVSYERAAMVRAGVLKSSA